MNTRSQYTMDEPRKDRKITPRQIALDANGLKEDGQAPKERRRVVTPEELKVSGRVFQAIEILRERKTIHYSAFLQKHGINRGNLSTLRTNPEKRALPVYLLVILVEEYGVDATWLLTGRGTMFGKSQK